MQSFSEFVKTCYPDLFEETGFFRIKEFYQIQLTGNNLSDVSETEDWLKYAFIIYYRKVVLKHPLYWGINLPLPMSERRLHTFVLAIKARELRAAKLRWLADCILNRFQMLSCLVIIPFSVATFYVCGVFTKQIVQILKHTIHAFIVLGILVLVSPYTFCVFHNLIFFFILPFFWSTIEQVIRTRRSG